MTESVKHHYSHLSARSAQTLGYGPLDGLFLAGITGNNRVRSYQEVQNQPKTPIKPGTPGITHRGVKRRRFTLRGQTLSKPHKPLKTR